MFKRIFVGRRGRGEFCTALFKAIKRMVKRHGCVGETFVLEIILTFEVFGVSTTSPFSGADSGRLSKLDPIFERPA